MICRVDQTEHADLEALHKHLRTLKVTQEQYYTEFAPVLDRGTGEPIPFKAPATEYLKREFVDKNSLKRWFKDHPEDAKVWATNWLRIRKEEKGLTYAPPQVELRSLFCPSIPYYQEAFAEGYNGLCQSLGYAVRFDGHLTRSKVGRIVVDTREQKPLDLSIPHDKGTLKCGDYGLVGTADQQVYVERKSLSDFLGTLSERETRPGDSNYARLIRELERAEEVGGYIVMLVEQKLSDCLAYNSIPYLKRQFGHIKVRPEHVFHNLRALFHRFPTSFQALFVENRDEAAKAVVAILSAGESVKRTDLQLAHDLGELDLS